MALLKKKPATPVAKPAANATSQIFAKAKQVNDKQKADVESRKERLFDLSVPIGEHVDILLLDDAPFAQYEHQYQTSGGRWDGFAVCLKEKGHCPACASLGKEGTYVIRLTCLDTRQFTIKNGDNKGKTIYISRKSVAIKPMVAQKFARLLDDLPEGSPQRFRGMYIRCHRDSDKEGRSGGSFRLLKVFNEAQIAQFIAKYEPDLKRREELKSACDYKRAYPVPTEAELSKQFGAGRGIPGTEEFDESYEEASSVDDEIPF